MRTREQAIRRSRIRVTGTVQGVGYRPFVHRLAHELGLAGFVFNDSRGVVVEAQGEPAAVKELTRRLRDDAPPLAIVARVDADAIEVSGEHEFEIRGSPPGGEPVAMVSADSATCEACLAELRDPADRRHRYPFTNCTDCGPRFTIVRGVPYDRPLTTMASFEMCDACRREYEDPLDRRFHAQPNACPECGPRARLTDRAGRVLDPSSVPLGSDPSGDAVAAAAGSLRVGRIVAVKGLGGFHLACRADDESAVAELRARKHREDKPFALMVADATAAERLVELTAAESELLAGRERPIVIARRRARSTEHRCGALGRARPLRARGDAPLLAASSPSAGRRRRAARDDARGTSPTSRSPSATRTRSGASGRLPTSFSSTTARSTCEPTTRWCAL